MTNKQIARELREHALHHRTGDLVDVPSDQAFYLLMPYIEGLGVMYLNAPRIELRMFLLFIAESLS